MTSSEFYVIQQQHPLQSPEDWARNGGWHDYQYPEPGAWDTAREAEHNMQTQLKHAGETRYRIVRRTIVDEVWRVQRREVEALDE